MVDQLRQFGELRRGWLGVRIQQVTDEIAESLSIKPARGALVAGVDDKGPAKPAGIEPGDVVVKFDGKDIKDPKDLSRVVADTAVGKEVDVVIIRKGKEETRKVTLGRLEDNEKVAAGRRQDQGRPRREAGDAEGARPRSRHAEQGSAHPVQDQGQRQGRRRHRRRQRFRRRRKAALAPATSSSRWRRKRSTNAADIKKRVDQLKKDGKKSVLLLVSNGRGRAALRGAERAVGQLR